MAKYRVAQAGAGHRGVTHIRGFAALPDDFELVALCDIDAEKLARVAGAYGIAATYADADEMLAATKPDVFCFVTQPDVRLPMIEVGVKHGVRAIAFEKPMAMSLAEARQMRDLCVESGIKTAVCHQHKYLTSFEKLMEIVSSGDLGDIEVIRATCRPGLAQLGTHYTDYMLWINGRVHAEWVVGHVNGRNLLSDNHPSPDFTLAEMRFANGVYGYLECGYLAPKTMAPGIYWTDDRLSVYGTHGYAWADPEGRWAAFTRSSKGEVLHGEGDGWMVQERDRIQPLYLKDLAHWLGDDAREHPCNIEIAYHGYEIMEGLCLSALNNTRVDLPMASLPEEDLLERMGRELPEVVGSQHS